MSTRLPPTHSTPNRLPAPYGRYLKAGEAIEFSFEGQIFTGVEGDTLASALIANNCWLMSRSFKYHRPRGPMSMAGQEANTLVQTVTAPNVLADQLPISQGLVAFGQNYSGSLERDKDQALDTFGRFLKVGFYYRTFFKPKGIWAFWERIIRRKAGLGVLQTDAVAAIAYHDKAYLFCDLAIIGAGPAGLQAALRAAMGGANVVLFDTEPQVGGSLNYYRFDEAGTEAQSLRESLVKQLDGLENLRVYTNATCTGWFKDHYLSVVSGTRYFKVRAKHTIFANGVFEQQAVFRNNDLPGVIFASAAQRLTKLYGVKPGKQAVVFTNSDQGYLTALDLIDAGVAVAAIIDARAEPQSHWLKHFAGSNTVIKNGWRIHEAIATKQHLSAVEARSASDESAIFNCDLLCMSVDTMPAWHLPCIAGASLQYSEKAKRFTLSGMPPNAYLAGSIRGIQTLTQVLADGDYAARQVLSALGLNSPSNSEPLDEPTVNKEPPANKEPQANKEPKNRELFDKAAFDEAPRDDTPPAIPVAISKHPDGKDFVDFDEDLQVQDIHDSLALGYREIQLLKRYSTLGMGPSQGRHSALPAARILADATGQSLTQTGITTARAPAAPESLAVLAGRSFSPYRRTAMHSWHVARGAQMMPAGAWLRPAYYGQKEQREACIAAEVHHVRNAVGMIDLSTLGGIELRGPDALVMLNRMYTGSFTTLAIGKARYALQCNLQGAIADDGVVFRIAEHHYYLSATTTGVDKAYREMTRWNAQWRLSVDIYNVTSAYAAVNVAGPSARKLLQQLMPETPIGDADLPYMSGLCADIAGIPARIIRVGFVGECGFEIHVPALFGKALWQALFDAGEGFNLKPFGVEAQRVLRLEKGHIIVGQDTDALSHPIEVAMGWAVKRQKPFFVGQRSLQIIEQQALTRALVAFTLPAEVSPPKEGHLVLDGDNITGQVCSCSYSPTLDCIIGMAYAGPDKREPGSVITVKIDGGKRLEATVCKVPFYDPDNQRQAIA